MSLLKMITTWKPWNGPEIKGYQIEMKILWYIVMKFIRSTHGGGPWQAQFSLQWPVPSAPQASFKDGLHPYSSICMFLLSPEKPALFQCWWMTSHVTIPYGEPWSVEQLSVSCQSDQSTRGDREAVHRGLTALVASSEITTTSRRWWRKNAAVKREVCLVIHDISTLCCQ